MTRDGGGGGCRRLQLTMLADLSDVLSNGFMANLRVDEGDASKLSLVLCGQKKDATSKSSTRFMPQLRTYVMTGYARLFASLRANSTQSDDKKQQQ